VVIFGAGVFTGGLLVNSIQHPHSKSNHHTLATTETHEPQLRATNNLANMSRPQRTPDILGTNFVSQLDDALQLAPDQRASIQKIIADGQERNHAIWTNNSAQMRAVIQDVRHHVRESLTADQQKEFDALMKRTPRRQQNATNAPSILAASNSPPVAPAN
jgi:hypothetical protein